MNNTRLTHIISMITQINEYAVSVSGKVENYTWCTLIIDTRAITVMVFDHGNDVAFCHPLCNITYPPKYAREDRELEQCEEYIKGLVEIIQEKTA